MEIAAVKTTESVSTAAPTAEESVEWALGPGSVTWRVMKDPTVFVIGLLREAMLLTLHPAFAAAAVDHDSFGDDPIGRFQHVAWYTYAA
ncbi:oxygenase MpaB family protein, partial [Mycobacterium sp.]|uniref:oxygenase MpaB family protein n=1 Tax=Mycobacterium sp. TaxID=1785 RepID=UPI003CA97930